MVERTGSDGFEYSKIVKVSWIDSASFSGWTDKKEASELLPDLIRSIGYLVTETEDSITLSSSIGSNEIDSPIAIPRVAIVSIEIFQEDREHE